MAQIIGISAIGANMNVRRTFSADRKSADLSFEPMGNTNPALSIQVSAPCVVLIREGDNPQGFLLKIE